MRRTARLLAVPLTIGALLMPTAAQARTSFSTAPASGTGTASGPAQATVTRLAIAHHPTYDRMVLTFSGGVTPSYDVRYVPSLVADASGQPVTLQGAAIIRVVLRGTSTSTPAPQGTRTPLLPAIRQVKGAGDFEAVTTYGIGVSSTLAFRAFRLTAPDRLVIDVQIPAAAGGGTGGTSQLPFTGAPLAPLAVAGAALVLAGAFAVRRVKRAG